MKKKRKKGFTLLEILVVVLIIGILAAIAVPMYQKSVMKSRFNSLMPVAKAVAENNEVYYLEHGHYSTNPNDLSVSTLHAGLDVYPNGTGIVMYDDNSLSYVLTDNNKLSSARYVVYQKQSKNFPDTSWCEAGDEKGEELCVSLGGEYYPGNSTGEENWKAYLLAGVVHEGDSFAGAGNNNVSSYISPRALAGDPQCNSTNTVCEYTYTSGEKATVRRTATGAPILSCDSNNLCSVGQTSTGDGVIQVTLKNGTASDSIYFDKDGKMVGVLLNTSEGIFVFDGAGNIKTLSMGQKSSYNAGSLNAKYDENGNVRFLNISFNGYYYNENGTAVNSNAPVKNVSQYKITQEQMSEIVSDSIDKVRDYAQYNVCELFPEAC